MRNVIICSGGSSDAFIAAYTAAYLLDQPEVIIVDGEVTTKSLNEEIEGYLEVGCGVIFIGDQKISSKDEKVRCYPLRGTISVDGSEIVRDRKGDPKTDKENRPVVKSTTEKHPITAPALVWDDLSGGKGRPLFIEYLGKQNVNEDNAWKRKALMYYVDTFIRPIHKDHMMSEWRAVLATAGTPGYDPNRLEMMLGKGGIITEYVDKAGPSNVYEGGEDDFASERIARQKAQSRIEALEIDIEKISLEGATAIGDLKEATTRIEGLEKVNKSLSDDLAQRSEELQKESADLSSTTKARDVLKSQVTELKAKVKEVESENKRLFKENAKLEPLRKQLSGLQVEVETMKKASGKKK